VPHGGERFFCGGGWVGLADGYFAMGLALLREGKLDAAESSLQQAVTLNPEMRGAHMFLGIKCTSHESASILYCCWQAIKKQPNNSDLYVELEPYSHRHTRARFEGLLLAQVLHGAAGEAGGLAHDEVGGDVELALAVDGFGRFDLGAQGTEGGLG